MSWSLIESMNFPKENCFAHYMNGNIFSYDVENPRNCIEKYMITDNKWYLVGEKDVKGHLFGKFNNPKNRLKHNNLTICACVFSEKDEGDDQNIEF